MTLTAACSKVGDGKDEGAGKGPDAQAFVVDYDGKAVTPAKPVEGAKTGGVITILEDGAPEHLDPQQIYVSNALSYGQLVHRSLTGYIETGKAGEPLQLVGDLATNAGVKSADAKVWTYTLRDGLKFEDGSPITSKDVAYGIARSFGPQGTQGPQFLQSALDEKRGKDGAYPGPGGAAGDLPPGVTTPDDKTIIFTFTTPHVEIPYLLAFPTSTPVQKSKDTKEKYDNEWQSSGPYKRAELVPGVKLTLEKNPNWDPASDPIRHQYVDKFVFDFTTDAKAQTDRISAAAGGDAAAVMVDNVPPDQIPVVKGNADLMKRVAVGPNQYVYYMNINTSRVTDLAVRQALNYAFDRDAYLKAIGGYDIASPASTIMSPVVPGYKNFDAYPSLPDNHGDVEKAKKLLEGKTVGKLTFCTSNTPTNQTVSAVIIESFKRVGLDVTAKFIERSAYYTEIGRKGIECDLMSSAWGQDYPDGESTLGVLMDGSKIVAEGNNNYSYFAADDIIAKLKELRELTDRGAAAAQYGDLDKLIMEKYAPLIPLRYGRNFTIYGPQVGNTFLNQFSQFDVLGAYVKS
ncbi:peptide/nickel transport system substrate-binding protein [Allocatelliglobosispora scoriae]|uniref:Peptide/nickel transport system substrate-binding protein n=1 Tax=Allocatelliglobosispora scoriae TaxID=643052 RepID=A0A841BWZ9_9ACTN|nr:ABC transporter substrate-binding protein [Allocatelliglobosispora scoriae]MBB5871669.1 peptide/nickel transport system substrate-binding protein [Allocatelliglobosispora scoriae]